MWLIIRHRIEGEGLTAVIIVETGIHHMSKVVDVGRHGDVREMNGLSSEGDKA